MNVMNGLLSVLLVIVLGCLYGNGQAAVPSAPTILTPTVTATSISLTWNQQGGSVVDSYEINYSYIIGECGVANPPVNFTLADGSQRSYIIVNDSDTPVEEASVYSVSLTAINSVGRSTPSNTQVTTSEAAPGIPEALQTASVSVTNITIQWDRVNCQDRNGHTDSYRVLYYPTSNARNRVAQTIVGTGDSKRMVSGTGLPPRTSYTFEVQASNPNIDMRGPPATITVSTTAPQNLGFLLNGQLYPNNSVVTVADIGGSFFMSALFCLTPSLECCSDSETPNAASVIREWYLPDGRQLSSTNSPFIRSQISSTVSLHCNAFSSITPPTGVFRCEIPDASGMSQNIYVGIYPEGDGSPAITSVLFDRNLTTLTCTSTGGPPTTVTWRKNGVPINESLYEQSQRLVNAESATYESVLFNDDIANFVGAFTCEVSNVRGTNQETTELNGVSIDRDQLNVGDYATARCFSDDVATRMEWLLNGVVIESDVSTQELDLVFSPVNDSIHNQVYVCRVTRERGAQAEQNFTAKVDVPLDAVTATVSSSDIAIAGMIYNLTCTVSKTVDGLLNSPTATWTTAGGGAVSNGNEITVSTMTTDDTAISILTFDPLRTSHEGSYSCDGTLTSPALQAPLTPSAMVEHNVKISTPDVNITVPPGPLFAGSTTPLTLTCTISINSATDILITTTTVDVTWLSGVRRLSNDSVRMTISRTFGSGLSYTSTLTISPPSTVDRTFTCRARARPPPREQSFIAASEEGVDEIIVSVEVPPPPTVSIAPFNSLEMAGQSLTLNCSVTIQDGIRGTPTLTWTRVDDDLPTEATSEPPLLSFSSLYTSHAGRYTCTARLFIPEARVDVSGVNTTTVTVEIPQPTVTITGSPRNMTFFPGLIQTFTCLVVVHPAVDTPVRVQGNWEKNGTVLQDSGNDRISVSSVFMETSFNIFQITFRLNPMNFDDAGTYSCSVAITQQISNFVAVPELPAINQRIISVQAFPPPIVAVASQQPTTNGCGETRILNCTSDLVDDFIAAPTFSWRGPDDSLVSTEESANPRINTDTKQLIFRDITIANSGVYKCRVSVGGDAEAATVIVIDTTFPGVPLNARCGAKSSASILSFFWDSPSTNLRNKVVGYRAEVKGLRHRADTREVVQFAVDSFNTEAKQAIINQGLAGEVPYNITVKALNLAGCGEEEQLYCFTQEGVPPSPENVEIVELDATSIEVRWKKFTLVELKGLANYTITYTTTSLQTRQAITVPWSESSVVIRNLNPGMQYRVMVSISTTAGEAAPIQVVYSLPLDGTTKLPDIDKETSNNTLSIVIGVVIAAVIVLILLIISIAIVIFMIRRHKAKLEYNKAIMLRSFEVKTEEKQSVEDIDTEEEATVTALEEKPPLASAGECELVQSPVHVPSTFTAQPEKKSIETEGSALNANGNDYKQP